MPKSWIDSAVPIVLILAVVVFFWIKLKMGKYAIKLIEWMKDTFKSKKHKEGPSNSYEYIEYGE